MSNEPTSAARQSIRRHVLAGLVIVIVLGGGVGGWASTMMLSGALIAPGSVVVDSNVKKVQHPTGGIVGELLVRDGDRVRQGKIVVKLDDTITRANLAIVSKEKEIKLIDREKEGVAELWRQKLVQLTKLTELERQAARLEGEAGQLVAQTAQVAGKVSETELQILQIDRDLSSEVAKETREIDAKIGEFVERKITAEDQLKRVEIRAPQDGTVFQATVHTVGGVINAGEAIMLIVPDADALTVEARVNPQDIDQVKIGQTALLRLSAFNQRTTPEIYGSVARISADISTDQRTGASYYTVRISLPPEEVARLGEVRIVPGMPVEAFVQTGERTMLSYLVKPLSDHLMRMFREK